MLEQTQEDQEKLTRDMDELWKIDRIIVDEDDLTPDQPSLSSDVEESKEGNVCIKINLIIVYTWQKII